MPKHSPSGLDMDDPRFLEAETFKYSNEIWMVYGPLESNPEHFAVYNAARELQAVIPWETFESLYRRRPKLIVNSRQPLSIDLDAAMAELGDGSDLDLDFTNAT